MGLSLVEVSSVSSWKEDDPEIKDLVNQNEEINKEESNFKTCYIKFELAIQDFGCGI
jgi:hypothetical protein